MGSAIHGSIHSNAAGEYGAVIPEKADGSKEVFKILIEHGASE